MKQADEEMMRQSKEEEGPPGKGREINVKELAALVRAKRGACGLRATAQEISQQFGEVSTSTLSRVEQGKLPDLDTYMRLCRWLGASPSQFASHARSSLDRTYGFTEEMNTPQKVEAHLRADRELRPEQAQALAEMMRLAYEAIAPGTLGIRKGE